MSERTQTLQVLYEETARRFAERVRQRFPHSVHSVVLYGSVARGTAGRESDVDVLVLTANGRPSRDEMIEISEGIDYENNYRTFIIATGMTPQRLEELRLGGFPIAEAILSEGMALYDDGTFERIRQNAAREG